MSPVSLREYTETTMMCGARVATAERVREVRRSPVSQMTRRLRVRRLQVSGATALSEASSREGVRSAGDGGAS